MAINIVNTTNEEKNFNFLTNQSSILHTADTNNITVNGVNVIVDKPKKGDVMCVTRYTNESGTLLPADSQKVIWIDGLSINPKQLSQEFEPVGICVVVNGNKAMVKYRKEQSKRWAASERWELPYSPLMNNGNTYSVTISLNDTVNPNSFVFNSSSRNDFVNQLQQWFLANATSYSAELVELDTDLPAVDTSDTKDGDNYRNRIIINAVFTESWNNFYIEAWDTPTRAIGKPVKAVSSYYKSNGFKTIIYGGCCRAKYYDFYSINGGNLSPGDPINSEKPVSLTAFSSYDNCQILRDNFASYDEYIDSMMVKYPCGRGGTITEFPCGKDNTYKLVDCTFNVNVWDYNNYISVQEALYPAANYAASIDINAPKLSRGNWWLPSSAEMAEMMRDVTYNTTFWDKTPDIVNTVLEKMVAFDSANWSMLSASTYRWTSSRSGNASAYAYYGNDGNLFGSNCYFVFAVDPITIYEF